MCGFHRGLLVCLFVSWALLLHTTVASAGSSKPVEADEKMVESCRFLQTIVKQAFIGTVNSARKSVMKEAGKLGATHVVFTGYESANAVNFASASGRAYVCADKNAQ